MTEKSDRTKSENIARRTSKGKLLKIIFYDGRAHKLERDFNERQSDRRHALPLTASHYWLT
jgi:hypothetical protein